MSYMNDMDNPLLLDSRLYQRLTDDHNNEDPITHNPTTTHDEDASLLVKMLHFIQSYFKIYELYNRLLATFANPIPTQDALPKQEEPVDIESYNASDSDVEIIKVNQHIITNDYHLLQRNTPIRENSILLLDDHQEQDEVGPPFGTTSSSDILRELAFARLNRTQKYHDSKQQAAHKEQYGTDLSIADT